MSPSQRFMRMIWRTTASLYDNLIRSLGKFEHTDPHQWSLLEQSFAEYLRWVDLAAASALRFRATGKRTKLPEPPRKLDEPTLFHGLTPELDDVAAANEWYLRHRIQSDPIVRKRAAWVKHVEQEYAWRKRHSIAQILRDPARREAFTPVAHLDRQRRDSHTDIQQTSEQIELAMPDVGPHFPLCFYYSRDDRRVRPTHAAMHGFLADVHWEGWRIIRPGAGFGCRCYTILVSRLQARAEGWIDALDRPKFLTRWPNTLAENNFREGLFPDKGWRGPKFWAALDAPPIARVA